MHRNLRRTAVAAVSAALVAAGAAGCGNDDTPAAAAGTTDAKDITVWLMNGSAPDPVIKAVTAEFNAKHPNTVVKVEIQQWDGIQEKTTTALAGASSAMTGVVADAIHAATLHTIPCMHRFIATLPPE